MRLNIDLEYNPPVLAPLCILGGKLADIWGETRVFLIGLGLSGTTALIVAVRSWNCLPGLGLNLEHLEFRAFDREVSPKPRK